MEEHHNNGEEHLDKYTKDKVEKGINDLLEEKELKIKWRKEISENQSMQEFFQAITKVLLSLL